jgi:acyl carrier protein
LLGGLGGAEIGGFLTPRAETGPILQRPEPPMSVKSEILSLFQEVASEQQRTLAPLSDGLGLLESGLDSLCFAIIVARLEDRLGLDPFGAIEDDKFPVTVGDFIKLYENAAPGDVAA